MTAFWSLNFLSIMGMYEIGNQPGPTGLMRCTAASAIVPMKEFIK